MALVKCPRCELNYMEEGKKYCDVCMRELKGDQGPDDTPELCMECGERPVIPGGDYCVVCQKAHMKPKKLSKTEEMEPLDLLDLDEDEDELEGMQEIALDGEDEGEIPETELEEINSELGEDEEFEDDFDEDFDPEEDEE